MKYGRMGTRKTVAVRKEKKKPAFFFVIIALVA